MNNGLPQSWATASLSDIADINPRHPRDLDDELPVSFAPMSVLSESRPEFNGLRERPLGEVRKGFTHFAEGDVLFAKITPCMENGKAAVATRLRNGLGCGTTELHVLRPLGGVAPLYIYHFIHQPSFRRAAEANFTGSAGQLRVPVAFIESAEVPIAPLGEQRRIVAKLEKVLGKVDACQERLAKIPTLLKRFRQSVLAAACSGRLTSDWREENSQLESATDTLVAHGQRTTGRGRNTRRMKPAKGLTLLDYSDQFPTTWAWLKVRELVEKGAILDVQDGNHGELYPRAEDFGKAGVPYISAEHVINDRVQIAAAPLLKNEKAQQLRIGFAKANDVILTHNATVGRVALLPPGSPDVVLSTSTTYYRVDEAVLLASYLATFLRSHYFQSQLEAVMEQTTRNQVSVTKQVEFGIAVPPLAEQEEIVRRVDSLFALADQIEARYAKAKMYVEKLTPSLLARAFRGELVHQDPNDEPASALLERIKQNGNTNKFSKRKAKRAALATV
jgi:type I restriction enzyme S subunit